jgi:hypothetical protein
MSAASPRRVIRTAVLRHGRRPPGGAAPPGTALIMTAAADLSTESAFPEERAARLATVRATNGRTSGDPASPGRSCGRAEGGHVRGVVQRADLERKRRRPPGARLRRLGGQAQMAHKTPKPGAEQRPEFPPPPASSPAWAIAHSRGNSCIAIPKPTPTITSSERALPSSHTAWQRQPGCHPCSRLILLPMFPVAPRV